MTQRLRIAALQPALRRQHSMPNMVTLRQSVQDLPSGIHVVVLPEMWTGLPQGQSDEEKTAECRQFLQTLAKSCDVHVVGGSFEAQSSDGSRRNVCLVVNRHGQVVGEYAKRTLFSHEQEIFRAGQESVICELDGFRIAPLVCADLWISSLVQQLIDRVDAVCVPAKTAVPSDSHVQYARTLWHGLALVRAMESGLPVVVSDWASGRHALKDVDMSVGSVHAPGTDFDRGVLYKRHHKNEESPTSVGPIRPTATAHTSATAALGTGVYFTAGAATICNPGHRPEITKIQQTISRGEPGTLYTEIDLQAVADYRDYRRSVGLLPIQEQ